MTTTLDLAVIGGDGIGPEVTAEALKVLRAAVGDDVTVAESVYPLGAEHYLATGEILHDETLAALAKHDAILFGAVGGDPRDPRLAGGIIERGLLLIRSDQWTCRARVTEHRVLPLGRDISGFT